MNNLVQMPLLAALIKQLLTANELAEQRRKAALPRKKVMCSLVICGNLNFQ